MKTFILYWYNNPVKQLVTGLDVQDAVRRAGISDDRLNQMLVGWSKEEDDAMFWNNSDQGHWSHKSFSGPRHVV